MAEEGRLGAKHEASLTPAPSRRNYPYASLREADGTDDENSQNIAHSCHDPLLTMEFREEDPRSSFRRSPLTMTMKNSSFRAMRAAEYVAEHRNIAYPRAKCNRSFSDDAFTEANRQKCFCARASANYLENANSGRC